MNIHKNAGLTSRGRGILILRLERGEHPLDVATTMGISVRTVYKWRRRCRAEGLAELQDRLSRPHTRPASAISARTQSKTATCISWGRRVRVFDSQE